MDRRAFLASAGAAGLAASAGCLGFLETKPAGGEPPLPENRPDVPYVPTHVEGMQMVGTATQGRLQCALAYTLPHRFWLVRGSETERVNVEAAEEVHLMVLVWDRETGVVLPGATPTVELTDPDGTSKSFSPWQMLSQPMGVHFGDNVVLGPEGDYEVSVQVPPPASRFTGDGVSMDSPASFAFTFTFEEQQVEEISYRDIPADEEGTPGAVSPMNMGGVRASQVPAESAFPGQVHGVESTGGADLLLATTPDAGTLASGSDETYIVASLRTPHNRYGLASASLTATVEQGGDTVFDGRLEPTVDGDLGFHYGAVVGSAGEFDSASVTVETPPQLSRHEGYETTFLEFDQVSF